MNLIEALKQYDIVYRPSFNTDNDECLHFYNGCLCDEWNNEVVITKEDILADDWTGECCGESFAAAITKYNKITRKIWKNPNMYVRFQQNATTCFEEHAYIFTDINMQKEDFDAMDWVPVE